MNKNNYIKITVTIFTSTFILLVSSFSAHAFIGTPTLKINDGLVGWWTMDGKDTPWTSSTAGTVIDKSGNGNTGTLTNMNRSTAQVIGKIGQALKFDGVNNHIRISSAATTGTGSFSAFSWIRNSTSGIRNQIIQWGGASPGTGVWLQVDTDNKIHADLSNIAGPNSLGTVNDGKWHYVGVINNAGTFQIYVDGIASGSSQSLSPNISGVGTVIGGPEQGSNSSQLWYFNGSIDDSRIYNRALSPTEVYQLYNQGNSKYNITPQLPLTSGLVGWWTMDSKDTPWTSSTAGTVIDKSGNGRTGTLTNMNRSINPTIGKLGQALFFNGNNNYIGLGTAPITTNGNNHTICSWVKRSTSAGGVIMYKGIEVASSQELGFYLDNTGYLNYREIPNSGRSHRNNSITVPENIWANVCVVRIYNASVPKFYINGAEDTNLFLTDGSAPLYNANYTFQELRIGSNSTGGSYFNGSLDDIRIYNRALSATEIYQLYNQGNSKYNITPQLPLTSGLVGWWTMDGKDTPWTSSTAGTVIDKSGNGNTGTLTNMNRSTAQVIGKIGQALKFDGVNDYINTSFATALGDFTACTWFYTTASVPTGRIMDKNFIGGFWIGRSSTVSNQWGGGIQESVPPYGIFVTLSDNAWHHICSIRSGTTHTIIADGGAVSTSNTVSSSALDGSGLTFGVESGGGLSFFSGKIDDVRIYNRVLSVTEISQLYNLGR